jgi:geranylgeranyl transferase type-1 subunit beta
MAGYQDKPIYGFRGSPFIGVSPTTDKSCSYDCSHIAMTYTALACLIILGDDLKRVNKKAILEGLKALRQPDGRLGTALH